MIIIIIIIVIIIYNNINSLCTTSSEIEVWFVLVSIDVYFSNLQATFLMLVIHAIPVL